MYDYHQTRYEESPVRTHIWEALVQYGKTGSYLGGFLTALVSNDLCDAICRADEDNLAGIHALVLFVYNELPSQCWGSREKVKAWRELCWKAQEEAEAQAVAGSEA